MWVASIGECGARHVGPTRRWPRWWRRRSRRPSARTQTASAAAVGAGRGWRARAQLVLRRITVDGRFSVRHRRDRRAGADAEHREQSQLLPHRRHRGPSSAPIQCMTVVSSCRTDGTPSRTCSIRYEFVLYKSSRILYQISRAYTVCNSILAIVDIQLLYFTIGKQGHKQKRRAPGNGSNDYIDLIQFVLRKAQKNPSPQRSRHRRHDFRTLHRSTQEDSSATFWCRSRPGVLLGCRGGN